MRYNFLQVFFFFSGKLLDIVKNFSTKMPRKNETVLSYLPWYFQGFSSSELGPQNFASEFSLIVCLLEETVQVQCCFFPMLGDFLEENSSLGFL